MLTTCSWASAMLATQRESGNVAAREATGEGLAVRHTSVCRHGWIGRRSNLARPKGLLWANSATNNSPSVIDLTFTHQVQFCLLHTAWLVQFRRLFFATIEQRKNGSTAQLKPAHGVARNDESADVSGWLERVEKFNRDWFLKFEDICTRPASVQRGCRTNALQGKWLRVRAKLDGKAYRLDAYSIMSNHVHAIFKPFISETNLIGQSRVDLLTLKSRSPQRQTEVCRTFLTSQICDLTSISNRNIVQMFSLEFS
jgi:hypothetical protein